MDLPKGPFRKIEFIDPKERDPVGPQKGQIIIDDMLVIESRSPYHYYLIQIVAELQRQKKPSFENGVPASVVFDKVQEFNKTTRLRRKIDDLDSLKFAWREHIRGGKGLSFYTEGKQKGIASPNDVEKFKTFLENDLFQPGKTSRELLFRINLHKKTLLIIEHKLLPKLKQYEQTSKIEFEPMSIIEKYIQRLSDDFRIRNIPFLGQYKDMLDEGVYIPRELLRQDGTSLQSREIFKPGLTPSDPYVQIVEKRRTLIEGDPGSGKTILIRNIALNLAQNFKTKQLIPLYVELRAYDPTPYKTLDSYAFNIAAANARFTKEEQLEFENSIAEDEPKLVFLLDGYDEARNNPEILKKAILSLPSASKAVITSRKYSSTIGLTPDLRLELKPFDRPSQRLFVENAARVFGIEKSVKDRLLTHIGGFSPLSDMLQNPLFLLCICFAAKSGNDLPLRQIELLRQVKAGLLDHYITKICEPSQDAYTVINYVRNIKCDGVDIFDSVYSRLAFQHFSKYELEFSQSSIVNLVDAVAREYNVSQYRLEISNAILNCGLLVTGSFQNSYSFVHPLFMEYFAAQELARTPQWKEFVLNNYLDPSWKNVILFFIAQSGVTKFPEIYELLTYHDDYFYNGLLLAAGSISEMAEYPSQTEEIIDTFCKIGERHYLQCFLIRSLFSRECELEGDFRCPSRHLTGLAVESLIKRGTLPCLDKCVEELIRSWNWDSKFAQLVAHYGKQITPEIIADTLLKSDDKNLREQCASALGLMASEPAEAKLIECLLRDKDDLERRNAAFTVLKKTGSVRSVEAFMRVLANDRDDPDIRADCADTLGCLRAYQAVSTLLAILLKPTDDRWVRLSCIFALRKFGEPQVQAAFLHTLIHETDLPLRSACIYSLFVSESAINKLVEILANPKEHLETRVACTWAFRSFRSANPVNKLIEVLADQSDVIRVRCECAATLGAIADEKGGEALAKVLLDTKEDRILRGACATALGDTQSTRFVSTLVEILTNENDPRLQKDCARALARFDQKLAKDILIAQLNNPKAHSEQRVTCIRLVREIGSPQADKLLALLVDPGCDKWLRQTCIEEAGRLRMHQALAELTQLLRHDRDKYVRVLCAQALGKIGSDESIEALKEEALTSGAIVVREICIRAIGAIGSRVAASALKPIYIEMKQRKNEQHLAWHALETLATIPIDTSLNFCIQEFRNKAEEIEKRNQNQLRPILYNDPENPLRCLLSKIHTLSLQLKTIVSPRSLGLRDVTKE